MHFSANLRPFDDLAHAQSALAFAAAVLLLLVDHDGFDDFLVAQLDV